MSKKTKYIILLSTFLSIYLSGYGQHENRPVQNYYDDGEFNEIHYRGLLNLYNIKGDSQEKMVNMAKLHYLKSLQKREAGPSLSMEPHVEITQSSPSLAICNPLSSCISCTYDMLNPSCSNWPNLTTNAEIKTNFFDNATPTNYPGWCGRISDEYSWTDDRYNYSSAFGLNSESFALCQGTAKDPIGQFRMVPEGSNKSVRIGSPIFPKERAAKLSTRVKINSSQDQKLFLLKFAVVLSSPYATHTNDEAPLFSIRVYHRNGSSGLFNEVCCDRYTAMGGPDHCDGYVPENNGSGKFFTINWKSKIIDLSKFNINSEVIIEVSVNNCAFGYHTAYAYVDGQFPYEPGYDASFTVNGNLCKDQDVQITSNALGLNLSEYIFWGVERKVETDPVTYEKVSFSDLGGYYESGDFPALVNYAGFGEVNTAADLRIINFKNKFNPQKTPQTYRVTLIVSKDPFTVNGETWEPSDQCALKIFKEITVENCYPFHLSCDDCLPSFSPLHGKKYVLSAWAKTDKVLPYVRGSETVKQYDAPAIVIKFNGVDGESLKVKPNGPIIDGWQKIDQEFEIPEGASSIELQLWHDGVNDDGYVFFDDIKVFAAEGQSKSYVYDPKYLKLIAELDENNYATFYEYDQEGKLIRIKKETSRGVQTIQESFSNTKTGN